MKQIAEEWVTHNSCYLHINPLPPSLACMYKKEAGKKEERVWLARLSPPPPSLFLIASIIHQYIFDNLRDKDRGCVPNVDPPSYKGCWVMLTVKPYSWNNLTSFMTTVFEESYSYSQIASNRDGQILHAWLWHVQKSSHRAVKTKINLADLSC